MTRSPSWTPTELSFSEFCISFPLKWSCCCLNGTRVWPHRHPKPTMWDQTIDGKACSNRKLKQDLGLAHLHLEKRFQILHLQARRPHDLAKRSKQNRSFCIGAQDSYMTWAELGPRKGIGQTDISIRTQSPPELAKKEKIPPICTPKHEKSRYCDRIAHRLSESGLTPSKIPYFSNSTRGFITEFSETIQPWPEYRLRWRRREDAVGRLTDSSGSTSRVRICSSAVITVTFISPPLVWIELAEGERDRDGGEGGGVFAGELSRGGVHGVSKVGLDRLCWWFCLESWKESGVICKTKLNSHYPTQKGVGFHRTLEPTESFPKFYSFPHL